MCSLITQICSIYTSHDFPNSLVFFKIPRSAVMNNKSNRGHIDMISGILVVMEDPLIYLSLSPQKIKKFLRLGVMLSAVCKHSHS